jgi:hypothetical protein
MNRNRFLILVPVNGRQVQVRGHRYTVLVKAAAARRTSPGWLAQLAVTDADGSVPVTLDLSAEKILAYDVNGIADHVIEALTEWLDLPENERSEVLSL